MICKYCGKEIENSGGICPACEYRRLHPRKNNSVDIYSSSGAAKEENTFHIESPKETTFADISTSVGEVPLYAPPRVSAEKRRLSKKGIAIISTGIGLLLVAILIISGAFTSPTNVIIKNLKDGKYDAAYTLFVKNYNSNGSNSINSALKNRLDEIYTLYANGEMEYPAAATELETIKKMGVGELADSIDTTGKKIEKLKASKDSFTAAEKHYEKQEFGLAITAYKKVITEDSNYSTAKDKLQRATQSYRNSALSEASVFASNGDYAAGIETLTTALATLEKDKLIEKRIAEYKKSAESKGKAEIISVADKYAYKGDYEAAIKAINSALETKPELKDDKTLKANLKYYTEKYIENVEEQATALSDEGDYTAAAKLIKKAIDLVGENDKLTKLQGDLSEKLPTYLDVLSPTDKDDWSFTNSATLDSFGNNRADEENCIKLKTSSYAVYDISEGYEFFSCYVAAAKDIDEAVKCRIKVTASVGGETRMRECEISADEEAQELKFNVSDCTELKIEVSGEGASVIMYNAFLEKPEKKSKK